MQTAVIDGASADNGFHKTMNEPAETHIFHLAHEQFL